MTQALNALLEHAERQRDEALARLMQAEESSRRLRNQWEQLRAYRADYEARAPGMGAQAAPIELLRCHQGFVQRLDQALTQQSALIHSADEQLALKRQMLLERETHVASVRKLVERRLQDHQRTTARLEQKRSDEAATQRRWRDSAQHSTLTH
jgi:flagellar FliJ protein